MLSVIALHEVAGSDARLREALRAADLPTDDIEDDGRAFFEAASGDGQTIGYAGLERCAGDCLLRSVVVLPAHRGHGVGRAIVEATLRDVDGNVFLATTSAAPFFSAIGFSEVPRAEAGCGDGDPPTIIHLPIVGDHHEAQQASDDHGPRP
ncbi:MULTISPECIES: GNAT family N-acetyltransferase [unclassified Rhizobium]|uniref:GNAT family N-acetyltransferase n=1 Tax=Rhizobium sp. BG4 TaxID=2613770 RepID=UPI001FEE845D|nr:GNAT family N-acetyltransferase [Rhizobium sp. BG4]